jgi:hypothetical protein
VEDGTVVLANLGSANGTFLNGRRLTLGALATAGTAVGPLISTVAGSDKAQHSRAGLFSCAGEPADVVIALAGIGSRFPIVVRIELD